MEYLCGQHYDQKNKIYLYLNKENHNIHIYGEYRDYIIKNNIKHVNIAYDGNIIYLLPQLTGDKINSKSRPVKITFTKKGISISCLKLVRHFNIPVCPINSKGKYEGYNIPYTMINMEYDRNIIKFNLKHIPNWKSESNIENTIDLNEVLLGEFRQLIDHFQQDLNNLTNEYINKLHLSCESKLTMEDKHT